MEKVVHELSTIGDQGFCNVCKVAAGAVVLSGSKKYANLSQAQLCQEVAHRDKLRDRLQKRPQASTVLERIKAAMGKKSWSKKAR